MIRFPDYRIELQDYKNDRYVPTSDEAVIVLHGGLQDPEEHEQELRRKKGLKALGNLKNSPPFTVYMGWVKKDFEALVAEAMREGIEIHRLEGVEDWGYDFMAVRSNQFEVEGTVYRFNPFNEIVWEAKTLVFTPNDLRKRRFYPSTFLAAARELAVGETPAMLKAQIIALEQAVEFTEQSNQEQEVQSCGKP